MKFAFYVSNCWFNKHIESDVILQCPSFSLALQENEVTSLLDAFKTVVYYADHETIFEKNKHNADLNR